MNKHSVTLPDGNVVTRNSKSRTYSHVVVVADSRRNRIQRAHNELVWDRKFLEEHRGDEYEAHYVGRVAELEARIAELEAEGNLDEALDWGVWSWAGRADLGDKAAGQARKAYPFVRVVPVD